MFPGARSKKHSPFTGKQRFYYTIQRSCVGGNFVRRKQQQLSALLAEANEQCATQHKHKATTSAMRIFWSRSWSDCLCLCACACHSSQLCTHFGVGIQHTVQQCPHTSIQMIDVASMPLRAPYTTKSSASQSHASNIAILLRCTLKPHVKRFDTHL